MRTAVSGTFSVRIFVASSPSIPGIRTSMITTFGRRRSASATALAPSEASPITRMCGARESDRRSPSRTTSWSSTIRQVISDGEGVATPADDIRPGRRRRQPPGDRSDGERKLLGLGRRLEADLPPVADPELARQARDLLAEWIALRRAQVGAPPGVEALVERQLLRPVLSQVLEEVLTRPGPQKEQVRPDPRGPGLPGRPHHLAQLLRPVGDARQD